MLETQVQSLGQEDMPLQYSCLENSMDRGAWWATVHGVTELDITEQSNIPVALNFENVYLEKEELALSQNS